LREAIENYRENLSDMPAPFLMELYNLHESMDEEGNPLISTQQFSEIINLVNIYLVRRSICALDTSDITRLFPSILKDVLHDCNGNYANIVEYTKRNLINKQKGKSAAMPDDDALRSYLQYANVYNNRLTLRTIFNRIETVSNTAPVDLSKLSVEHLMPQTSTKEWLDSLNVDQITYDKNLHRLGNLTLASRVDNSKMKNKPWEYKQIILSNTAHLKMNQEILKNKEWTIKNIDDRTNELIDKIIELYPYQSASNDVIKKHDISIDWDGVIAFASLYEEDGSVEMQPGSEISKYSESTPDWVIDLFDDLLEDGIVKETEKGAVFLKSYSFYPQKKNSTSLSISASLILGGNRNGWDYWNDENGKPLSQNSELKKELTES
jgi:hypothetical protein